MAIQTPEPTRTRWARLRRPQIGAGAVLVLGGLLAMLVGGGALVVSQYAAQRWSDTDEAARAARQVTAPTPRWIDEPASPRTAPPTAVRAVPTATQLPATPTPARLQRVLVQPTVAVRTAPASDADQSIAPDPTPPAENSVAPTASASAEEPPAEPVASTVGARAPASAVEILGSEFRFLDPPEPGAQARVSVQLRNHAKSPTAPLRLTLSTRWLTGWKVVAADPPVLDDKVREEGQRAFDFPGLDADAEGTFELHLVATDDAVDPPELRLALLQDEASAAEIGRSQPETVAPRPHPGPARTIAIPRLGLRAAVVPTAWEPPAFVVGQLRQTANLSEGNTVLIGHLNGLAGNVFARLDQLEPGDEVIATSRGLEYRFVVSETMALSGGDSAPIQPTDDPRLTLMTCTGDWDPIHLDYSHRLWVVAEQAELAATTLAGETPGPLSRQLGLAPAVTLPAPAEPEQQPAATEQERPAAETSMAPPGPVTVASPSAAAVALPATSTAASPPETVASTPVAAGRLRRPESAAPTPGPAVTILQPDEGAKVGSQIVVRGRRTAGTDTAQPLWLLIRPEIEGSLWYPYSAPLTVRRDGTWDATIEVDGGPGIRHTIVVASVDAATDARLRRHVAQRPGQPLPSLPDAFEDGVRVVVERR